jgi:hypothetical protein
MPLMSRMMGWLALMLSCMVILPGIALGDNPCEDAEKTVARFAASLPAVNFWRPVTAIRNGDMDGNDATKRDPGWTPLNTTPMHPEYPSQAAIVAGVAVGVLEPVFGPQPALPVTATDLMDPTRTRSFNSIAQMAAEHKDVRIWGGIHFRNSLDVGEDMGRKIAAYLIDHTLTPAR